MLSWLIFVIYSSWIYFLYGLSCWSSFIFWHVAVRVSQYHLLKRLFLRHLLNSLFKVLFNFPLWYLLTVGLVPVFNLRWSLPFSLACIPKQPDSGKTWAQRARAAALPTLPKGWSLVRRTWAPHEQCWAVCLPYTTFPAPHHDAAFSAGLSPIPSWLLRESWLVSFPPLTNMLKFSRLPWSFLIRAYKDILATMINYFLNLL